MRSVCWSPLALRDLAFVEDHYGNIAPDFVVGVEQVVLSAARLLAATSHAGAALDGRGTLKWAVDDPWPVAKNRRSDGRGTRKWAVDDVPYILICRPTSEGILFVRVCHDRENWQAR